MKLNTLLLILFLFPTLSHADDVSFYGGLGYGTANYESTTIYDRNISPNQKLKDKPSFTEIYFGYDINQYISLEVGYADFDKVNKTYSLSPAGISSYFAINKTEEIDINRITLRALMEYPVLSDLSIFGLLGYSQFNLERTISGGVAGYGLSESGADSEKGLFFGLGAKYKFTNKFATRLQWSKVDMNDIDASDFRLSLEMNF